MMSLRAEGEAISRLIGLIPLININRFIADCFVGKTLLATT